MSQLTKEQQKLVADNHNLIYGFCHRRKYNIEEYYDICAIALCYAAQHYNPTKGSFSTYAYLTMYHEIIKDHSFKYRQKRSGIWSIPLDDAKKADNAIESQETSIVTMLYYQDKISKLSAKDQRLLQLLLSGYKRKEIAELYGYTRQWVHYRLEAIKNKMKIKENESL